MPPQIFSLLEYNKLTAQQLESFFQFCKSASLENLPAASNMWGTGNKSLLTILNNTDRFTKNGSFHILFAGSEVVACAGIYISDFSNKIALAGTRTWVKKEYRHLALLRSHILPVHKKWAIENQCKQIAICFNEYNKALIKIFYRNRLGETNNRLLTRTADNLFFSNINEVPFPVNIQNTPQWILYEKIDPNWEFDWYSIKHNVSCT